MRQENNDRYYDFALENFAVFYLFSLKLCTGISLCHMVFEKAGVKGSHIFYSELLNTVLALYFGAFYTFIVQLAEQGKVETFGFSSLGGMAGILLGVWILQNQ